MQQWTPFGCGTLIGVGEIGGVGIVRGESWAFLATGAVRARRWSEPIKWEKITKKCRCAVATGRGHTIGQWVRHKTGRKYTKKGFWGRCVMAICWSGAYTITIDVGRVRYAISVMYALRTSSVNSTRSHPCRKRTSGFALQASRKANESPLPNSFGGTLHEKDILTREGGVAFSDQT